ncbi:HdeD family acid-resistance protein [Microbacterium sp. NPDC056234]|uniref:HdeD family acid-resistance protein n=1 Tax=Microbacterium sp. NPDC056234 TaxID=3345757 RepID=UPI0035E003D0
MSDALSEAKSVFTSLRVALAVSGVLALIVGILLLVWPGKSAGVLTWILALFFLIAGLVNIAIGIFSGKGGGWARVGHIALGLLYIVVSVIAFANLAATTATLAIIVGIFIGVGWIVDGIVSLTLIKQAASKGWTITFAIISIIAGVIVLFAPLYTVLVLWWILGIALVVIGIVQIVRAITLGKDQKEITNDIRAELA